MRPLPAVLLDLHEELATGRLTLRRGRVAKSVDLVNGNPVSATSTPRDETLGHFLVGSGVITEAQHRTAVAKAAELGGKLGEALVTLGVLSVQQLIEQLGRQARHKLVQSLRWPQGAWRFDPAGEAVEGMQLRMVEVVLDGLRDTAINDLDRLARLDALSFELTARGRRLVPELRKAFGAPALAALDGGAALGELERAVGDRTRARIAIDAMILCGAVSTTVAEIGLGAPPPPSAVPAGATPLGRVALTVAPAARPVSARVPVFVAPRPARAVREVEPEDDGEPEDEVTTIAGVEALDEPRGGSGLFDLLFDEIGGAAEGAAPLDFMSIVDAELADDDSGVVSIAEVTAASADRDGLVATRQAILAEHQRLDGADHYAVLLIGRKATGEEIAAAAEVRLALLAQHRAERPELARERPRVDEIRAAYATARDVLLDDRRRSAYDRELAGGELVQVPPSLDIELTFRTAEELIARKQWPQALGLLKKIIAQLPTEADYHAALGWAEWHAGGRNPSAADTARASLNQALAINPDHPAAHDYKGQIDAALRNDDAEALFHLERAVELDPRRADALAALSALLITRGELRRLERILKRQLFRARGKDPVLEAKAWVRLARLYAEHLDDLGAATGALTTARRLAPRDSDVGNLVRDLDGKSPRISGPIRTGWRAALGDPAAGAALVRTTVASGHNDAAFLAASTMVALGTADVAMAAAYEAGRVRGIVLPATRLSAAQWAMLRHREDTLELGGLIELLAPAVHRLAPMTLAAAELEPAMRLDAEALPPVFAQVLAACANLLGVPVPDVYARAELGGQIHVVACDPPVLVAGDDALLLPERPDLVFRIVRALTFLWPGRAVGASRPGRVLRAVALAMFREASAADIGRDEPLAPAATEALAALTPDARTQARAASLRLLARGSALNLSNWARALTRTADRAGLLLCGDVPAAFAGARDVGELDRDLLDFAFAGSHVVLRRELGLVGPT